MKIRYLNSEYPEIYFKLWWEYLKRSEDYKEVCLVLRLKRKNPKLAWPEKFLNKDNPKAMPAIIRTLMYNGDVHAYPFDEWYEYKIERLNCSENFNKNRVIFKFNDFIKNDIKNSIDSLKRKLKRDPTLDEWQKYYNDGLWWEGYYIIDPTVVEPQKAMQLIQEKIKTHKYRKKPIRYEELERYLKVYDLWKDGMPMKDISNKIAPDSDGDIDNILRSLRKDCANAKKIIINTESNTFPGVY